MSPAESSFEWAICWYAFGPRIFNLYWVGDVPMRVEAFE